MLSAARTPFYFVCPLIGRVTRLSEPTRSLFTQNCSGIRQTRMFHDWLLNSKNTLYQWGWYWEPLALKWGVWGGGYRAKAEISSHIKSGHQYGSSTPKGLRFLRKIQKMHFGSNGWIESQHQYQELSNKSNGHVCRFLSILILGQFLCPTLGDRSHHQYLKSIKIFKK
jgi:hypothetical protein